MSDKLKKKLSERARRAEEKSYLLKLAGLISDEMISTTRDGYITKAEILDRTFKEISSIRTAIGQHQSPEITSSKCTISHDAMFSPWILDGIDGFLFVVDQGGKIEYITDNVTAFLCYNEQELRGKPIENIIHVGDRSIFNNKLISLFRFDKRASTSGSSNSVNTSGNGGSDISSSSGTFSSTSCSNDISPSMLSDGSKSFGSFNTSGSGSGANRSFTMNARLLINPRSSSSSSPPNDHNDNVEINEDEDDRNSDSPFVLSSLSTNSSNRKSKRENTGASTSDNPVSGGSLMRFSSGDFGRLGEPRYKNLQLSITLLQAPNADRSDSSGAGLVAFCMARRIPEKEETSLSETVELFSTKLDINGKILSIDTNGVSSTYSQYLNRDLINKSILDLCHPDDRQVLECHLTITVREGKDDLKSLYKFQVTKDKFLHVRTSSNRLEPRGDGVAIISLHSIITKEDETASTNSCQLQSLQPQKQLQKICTVTGISNSVQDSSIVASPASSSFNRGTLKSNKTSISVPFQPLTPVSPSSNIGSSEFPTNDCLSKMFPSGLSDFDSNLDSLEEESNSNVTLTEVRSNDLTSRSQNSQASVNFSSLISHPSFAPSVSSSGSNHINSVQHNSPIPFVTPSSSNSSLKMGNSFSNEFLAQGTSDQSNSSGSQNQNQQQTQQSQSQSGQSSQSQQSSGNSLSQPSQGSGQGSLSIGVGSSSGSGQQPQQPPSSSSSSRQPSPAPGSVPIQQLQMPSPEQTAATPQPIQSPSGPASTQKLRNLLTQGTEADSPGNSDINQSNSGSHDLLRELLNADEEEEISGSSTNSNRSITSSYGGNLGSNAVAGTSSAATTSSNQPNTPFGGNTSNIFFKSNTLGQLDNANNNNMLRKLLNEDDSKPYRRNELMAQLWKEEGQSSNQNSGVPTSLSELISPSPGSVYPTSRFTGGPGSVKRKSVDEHQLESETISGSQLSTPGNFGASSTSKRPAVGGPSPGPQYNQTGKSPLTGLTGGGTVATSSQSIASDVSSASGSVSGVNIGVSSSIGSTTPAMVTSVTTTTVTCGSTSELVASSGQIGGQPAQLAIQNPMLTSMLAQTPKTLPSTPISIPTSIVSQVPQERLPKNLEKKLIHTPANQMIGITSLATSISSPIVVSSQIVSSGGPQGVVPISNAPTSSSSHMTIKSRQPAPQLLPPQQQHQHQTQQPQPPLPQQLHQSPQQPHLPQTSPQAQTFVIANSGQLQNFNRTLHSQTQVQIVQTPPRYPVFPDNRATAQQIQQITNVQTSGLHQQIPNLSGQSPVSGQIKATLSGSTQSQQPSASQQQPLPQVSPQSSNVQSHVAFIDSISSTTSSSASSSNLASSSLLAAPQDPQDALLSDILDQVWSMQQEMNIESTQSTITATAHSTTDDSMLLDMLDEVLDPPSSNVAAPTTINLPIVSGTSGPGLASSPPDLNEMKAISEIQRQLMSCESSPSQQSHSGTPSANSRQPVFAHRSGLLPSPTLQQQPNFSNSPSFQSPLCPPPAYGVTSVPTATSGSVHGVTGPPQASQQQLILQQSGASGGPGMRRFPGPPHPNGNLQFPTQVIQHRASEHHQFNVAPGVVEPPLQLQPRGKGPIDAKKQRLFQNQQEYEKQRLLAQQTQQEYTLQTPQDRTVLADNVEMPPNVALQIKSRMGPMTPEAGQLSPRYPILNVGPSPGGVQAQSSLPQSSAGGNGPSSTVSTSLQSNFTSPSIGGPSTTYVQPVPQPSHRMSPHPYNNVPSPAGGRGPNSPAAHLQLASPQPSSTSSPVSAPHGWPPPVSTSNVPVAGGGPNNIRNLGPTGLNSNQIQERNPMLNAQLSQRNYTTATAQPNIRCTPQPSSATQRLCNSRGSMASSSPGPLHSASRNSPIPQYPSSPGLYQSDRQTPVSSVGPLTSTANIGQPRIMNQPRNQQQVPPRPQMMTNRVNSPRFATRGGVVSSVDDGNGPGSSMGSPYNYPQPSTPIMDSNNPSGVTPNQFIFDNRSVSGAQTSTSNASTVSSEFVKQELRAVIGTRVQQQAQQQQAQVQQQQQQKAQQPQSHHLHHHPQQQHQQPNQHLHQSSSLTPSQSTSSSSNMLCVSSSNNQLTEADLNLQALGFSFDFSEQGVVSSGTSVTSNCGPGSPLFNMFDSSSQVSPPLTSSSSTAQGSMTFGSSDNNSGSDQKRSLLQELLSLPP